MIENQKNIYRVYYFWSIPCGFYLFGFFPAPYYISFLVGCFFLLLCRLKYIDFNVFILFFINVSYFLVLLLYSKINVWSYYFIGLITFFLLICFRRNLSKEQINTIIYKTVNFSLIIISLDTLLRFLFPREAYLEKIQEQGQLDFIFYGYKHSFLFQDSNFVGLFILSIYFLLRNNIFLYRYKKTIISIVILMLALTFSRAAIISWFIVEAVILFNKARFNTRSKIMILMAIFLPLLYIIFHLITHATDQSFESKFMLIDKFVETFSQADLVQIFFGWGLDNTREHWGIAAHNLYNTLLLETGLCGAILILLSIIYCCMINKKTKYHLLSLGISCLSFGLIFTPIVIPLALNIISKGECKQNESKQ